MAASRIVELLRNWAARPSIDDRSAGRQYEDFAARLAKRLGYRILRRNFRFHGIEGDLLLDTGHGLVIWEVRGKRRGGFRPSLTIHPSKIQRLRILARWVQTKSSKPVRIQLLEVLGALPDVRWKIYEMD